MVPASQCGMGLPPCGMAAETDRGRQDQEHTGKPKGLTLCFLISEAYAAFAGVDVNIPPAEQERPQSVARAVSLPKRRGHFRDELCFNFNTMFRPGCGYPRSRRSWA